jgi:hypothetical protein
MVGGVAPLNWRPAEAAAGGASDIPPPPNAQTIVGMPTHGLKEAVDAAKAAASAGSLAHIRTTLPMTPQQQRGAAQPVEDRAARTIVGLPQAHAYGAGGAAGDASTAPSPARTLLGGTSPYHAHARGPEVDPLGEPGGGVATLVAGTPAMRGDLRAPVVDPSGGVGGEEPARTLLGVARPGIAPLHPGEARDSYDDVPPASELGATIGPMPHGMRPPMRDVRVPLDRHRPRRPAVPRHEPRQSSNRAIVLGAAAGGFAVAAVLVAVFWPSAPPLTARPKADAQGKEALEITCASCPDGTKLTVRDASAIVANHAALLTLPNELSVGENALKVDVDRPGKGRDETLRIVVHVAYRVRPDLATLQGDRPAISIVADAVRGTTVALGDNGGKPMQLVDGRGLEKIDVVEALTGISDDVKTLSRQVPYVVTPPDGPRETGVVSVSVGIVPLHIDAPGARVTTDQPSFVLAGHTMKGAEVIAAGRPIPVKPDGTFAQVMNVSSVGATQIEVRAKMPEMAPRLLPIRVRRVDNLEAAAKDFLAEQPLDFKGADAADALGKPVLLGGEVLETRRQGYQTIMLLDVAKQFGCAGEKGSCTARLVQGGDSAAKKGDKIRAYGRAAAPFTNAGKSGPEVAVEFTQKGLE